jgi:rubredoxin
MEIKQIPQKDLSIYCPICGTAKPWKDGLRYNNKRKIQRYLCRVCGYRFSEPVVKFNVIGQDSKLLHSSSNLTKEMVSNGDISIKKSVDDFPFLFSKDVSS